MVGKLVVGKFVEARKVVGYMVKSNLVKLQLVTVPDWKLVQLCRDKKLKDPEVVKVLLQKNESVMFPRSIWPAIPAA